jgi:hypothetical protein
MSGRRKSRRAVTSLLVIVDAHAMALEEGQKSPLVKEPSLITLLAGGTGGRSVLETSHPQC